MNFSDYIKFNFVMSTRNSQFYGFDSWKNSYFSYCKWLLDICSLRNHERGGIFSEELISKKCAIKFRAVFQLMLQEAVNFIEKDVRFCSDKFCPKLLFFSHTFSGENCGLRY